MIRRILVVDSDEAAAARISSLIGQPDQPVKVAPDGTTALECLVEGSFSLVLLDPELADIPGTELIRELRDREISVAIVLLLREPDWPLDQRAAELGVYDTLRKPVDPIHLVHLTERALSDQALREEVDTLRRQVNDRAGPDLVARGDAMMRVMAQAREASRRQTPLVIWGEEGTGKETLARFIHESGNDGRQPRPMVVLPCRALPESMFEETQPSAQNRGARPKSAIGLFTQFEGGTLVLSDAQDLALGHQARLAAALAARRSISDDSTSASRLIVLSRVDLAAAADQGAFRRDLLNEFDVLQIALPPLRERSPENLPLLIGSILERLKSFGYPEKTISPRALMSLERHAWPGNIAELERLIERLVVTTEGPAIGLEHLPDDLLESKVDPLLLSFDLERPLGEIVDEVTDRLETAYLRKALQQNHGRIDHTAAQSGLSRRSVSDKLKRLGIDKSAFRGA